VASFGYLIRADHLLFCRLLADPSPSIANSEGLSRNALVGCGRGLVGAVQVYAGLTLVNKVGAGRS
jgi:hypothetical protein